MDRTGSIARRGRNPGRGHPPGPVARSGVRAGAGQGRGDGGVVRCRCLRERGYEVFPVNPSAEEVEGDRCYRDLRSIPGGVDAVVIATRPEIAEETMRECADLDVKHVWMHRGPGPGSVSEAAATFGRERGISVIDGGCPCMFDPTAAVGHKAMRVILTLSGNVPRKV